MTTIAYRDGVLAADTAMCCGDSMKFGVTKIAIGPDGRMGGATGSAAFTGPWLEWIKGERLERPETQNDDKGSDSGLVIWPNGTIELFERGGSIEVDWSYFAMGSGSPEAMGALYAGATAEIAVKAAIAHDAHTGGGVTVLKRPLAAVEAA